ncbi:hypothetical protein D9M72_181600 [compost metagenome]
MKGTIIPQIEASRFRVNMDMAPRKWDCRPYQLILHRNPSLLNSMWLGTVTNLLNMPSRLFHEVVLAFLMGGNLGFALLSLFVLVPVSTIAFFLAGLCGRVHCLPLPSEVIAVARHSTKEELFADGVAGDLALVKSDWTPAP